MRTTGKLVWILLAFLALAIGNGLARRCPKVKVNTNPQVLVPSSAAFEKKIFFGQYIKSIDEWLLVGGYGHTLWTGTAYVFRRIRGKYVFQQRLRWDGEKLGGYFGLNLAITKAFGEPVICVGSPFDTPYGRKSGTVHVYDYRSNPSGRGKKWIQTQKLKAPGNGLGHLRAFYGYAVGMDGNIIAVGSRNQDKVDERGNFLIEWAGAVFIYQRTRSGAPYRYVQHVFGPRKKQQWGDEVRVSGIIPKTGTARILVGSPRHKPYDYGAAYSFVRNKQTRKWVLEEIFIPDESHLPKVIRDNIAHHGEAISLSTNPESVCVGGERGAGTAGPRTGGAYCYERRNGRWKQLGGMYPDVGGFPFFAQRMDRVGDVAVVGAWHYPSRFNGRRVEDSGAAFVFAKCSDDTWSRVAILRGVVRNPSTNEITAFPKTGDSMGKMVDMNDRFISVGVPKLNSGSNPEAIQRGGVYVYKYEVEPLEPAKDGISLYPTRVLTPRYELEYCPGKIARCPAVSYRTQKDARVGCVIKASGLLRAVGVRPKYPSNPPFPPGRGVVPGRGIPYATFLIPNSLGAFVNQRVRLSVRVYTPNLRFMGAKKDYSVTIKPGTSCGGDNLLRETSGRNELILLPRKAYNPFPFFKLKNCPDLPVGCPNVAYATRGAARVGCSLYANGVVAATGSTPMRGGDPLPPGTGQVPSEEVPRAYFDIPGGLANGAILNLRLHLWNGNQSEMRAQLLAKVKIVPGVDCGRDNFVPVDSL